MHISGPKPTANDVGVFSYFGCGAFVVGTLASVIGWAAIPVVGVVVGGAVVAGALLDDSGKGTQPNQNKDNPPG